MKRVITSSMNQENLDQVVQDNAIQGLKNVEAALVNTYKILNVTGLQLHQDASDARNYLEQARAYMYEVLNYFDSVEASTAVKADRDIPKGYYDDYYGQTAYEEYGDLVSEQCSGMIISKRADEGEEPGGLIYEANRLGIEDFFDLLKCLEGMCYNGKAVEISDYQYRVN